MNFRLEKIKALPILVALLLGLVLIPFIYLLFRAGEKSIPEAVDLLLRAKTLEVLATTTALLALVVIINVLLGTLIATGLHFVRIPYSRALIIPTVLPLAIPSYVFTYTWMALIPALSGIWAAAFILVLTTLPYMILAVLISLRQLDSGLIEVARSLGLTKPAIFFRVVLPQIRSSISAGALLSGLYVMSDYGAVSLLRVDTLTVTIANMFKSSYDRGAAAVISLLLVLASLIFVSADQLIKGRSISDNASKRSSVKNTRLSSPSLRVATLTLTLTYALLSVLIPFSVLISRFIGNPNPIDYQRLLAAATSTILVSAIGAVMALAIAIPLAILTAQGPGRFAQFSERVILVGHALPGVVIGLALVSLGVHLGALYQSIFLLAFAYALLFLAKAVAATTQALQLVPPVLREVAATLGKNRTSVTASVVFPIALPSIGLGALLVFLTAMKELPATIMLRPTGMDTLATQIWSYASISRFNDAAPYALLLVLIAAIPTFLLTLPPAERGNQAEIDSMSSTAQKMREPV